MMQPKILISTGAIQDKIRIQTAILSILNRNQRRKRENIPRDHLIKVIIIYNMPIDTLNADFYHRLWETTFLNMN